jgi:hypothetical protein
MSLAAELKAVTDNFVANAPTAFTGPILAMKADHKAKFNLEGTIKVGEPLPAFELPDAVGKEVSSDHLLAKGPLL